MEVLEMMLKFKSSHDMQPLELNATTTGDGWIPTFVPWNIILVVDFALETKYFLIASSAFLPNYGTLVINEHSPLAPRR